MRTLRSIRHRLALLLALPTGALVLLAAFGTAAEAARYRAADRTDQQVALAVTTQELVRQLQRERGLTAGLLGGDESFRARLGEQRAAADQARQRLDQALAAEPPGTPGVRTALGGLGTLAALRGRADTGTASRAEALDFFSQAIGGLSTAAFADVAAEDRELQAALTTLRVLGEAAEAAALERGTLNGVFAAGAFGEGDYPAFARVLSVKNTALAQAPRTATAARGAALAAALRSPAAVAVAGMEQRALAAYGGGRLPVRAADWWQAASTLVDDLHRVQAEAAAESRAGAAELRSAALWSLGRELALALGALAGAAALGVLAGRSVTRPLAALVEQANQLADRVLPEAVARIRDGVGTPESAAALPGTARDAQADELAEVAAALDRVAATTLRLAVEQAVLRRNSTESLANLGRRNQALVTRQLGFLSGLEQVEHDPGVLANLFELDHLATRMRRNAESILVLVGEPSPRRWERPVAMGDVVRAALGEVEDYRRVVLRQLDEARLDGGAVAEVAHLLAELIENALAASAPDTDVEVFARISAGGYLIAVMDQGRGLTEAELTRANARLTGQESFLVGRDGLLGHYVVGRLAERLGARVRLAPAPVHGVTASVLLPAGLLTVDRMAVAR
ncbi:anti-sigma regulatory factor (Ser/Thr protein kinase) [Kitasatospora gansuensis]|uniref:histidine kinase n=1 Tax=Kitasatospora gansuensis TaxID=258050 RepID=A0A7W7WHD9_9ACTN|nr:ATP-binding protein [Kitasatospora gansuensis]MBB4947053.1 anti-sigma regulatory factor (Ser/Thr protein kinase) [Kitasatospora gansuensis]